MNSNFTSNQNKKCVKLQQSELWRVWSLNSENSSTKIPILLEVTSEKCNSVELTLLEHVSLHFWAWNHAQKWGQICWKSVQLDRVAFFRSDFFQNWYFKWVKGILIWQETSNYSSSWPVKYSEMITGHDLTEDCFDYLDRGTSKFWLHYVKNLLRLEMSNKIWLENFVKLRQNCHEQNNDVLMKKID